MKEYKDLNSLWYTWLYTALNDWLISLIHILKKKKEERVLLQKIYEIEKSLEYVTSIQLLREELKVLVFRILCYEIIEKKDWFKENFFNINTKEFFDVVPNHWLSKKEFEIIFEYLYENDYRKMSEKMYKDYKEWMKKSDYIDHLWKYW